MAVWLRTLIILLALPAWLATVAVYIVHGNPPPAEVLTIPLGFVAATSTPGFLAQVARRINGGGDPPPPPPTPPPPAPLADTEGSNP